MKLYRNFTTQQEIDLEYNFALTVPDVADWGEFYARQSASARSELDCTLDVRFGPTVDETVDIFPAREPSVPLLASIHGGYWYSRSSKDFSMVANGLVSHGITVAVMNYSLCPKVTISEITRQSPCLDIPRSGPPLLISFGEKETSEIKRLATEYHQARKANGLQGELLVQEGKHHFSAIEGLNDENSPLCGALTGFMSRCE